jgi:hypothetical protein
MQTFTVLVLAGLNGAIASHVMPDAERSGIVRLRGKNKSRACCTTPDHTFGFSGVARTSTQASQTFVQGQA